MSFEIGHVLETQEPFSINYLSRPAYRHRIVKTFTIEDRLSLAYVLGVLKGDGCAADRTLSHYYIDLQTKDEDFAQAFAESLSKVLKEKVEVKPLKRHTTKGPFEGYEVCKGHKGFFLWYKQHNTEITSIIDSLGVNAVAMFLRGIADSEGSPQKCIASLRIYNTDLKLLEDVQQLLEKYFDIKSKILSYPKHTCSFLNIQGNNNLRNFIRIGFSIRRKQKRLELLVQQKRRFSYGQD